jgi:hypothetical protein
MLEKGETWDEMMFQGKSGRDSAWDLQICLMARIVERVRSYLVIYIQGDPS